jgi:hypothetical protein
MKTYPIVLDAYLIRFKRILDDMETPQFYQSVQSLDVIDSIPAGSTYGWNLAGSIVICHTWIYRDCEKIG